MVEYLRRAVAGTFASFESPPFRLLFIGSLLSTAALAASTVSGAALVWELTESNTALALQFVAIGSTMVSVSVFAGAVADRWSPRALLALSTAMFVALQFALAALVLTDAIALWHILAGNVFAGAGFAVTVPARGAMIGALVTDRTRGNAVALQQVSFQAMQVVGPPIAGALLAISAIGFAGVLILQGVLYAASLVFVLLLPAVRPSRREGATSVVADVLEGARYVRRRPSLLIIVLSYLVVSLTVFPYFVFFAGIVDVLFEADAIRLLDDPSLALGVLVAVGSVGAFAASLAVAAVADRRSAFTIFVVTNVAFALALALFAATPSYELLLVVAVLIGGLAATFQSLGQALGLRYAHRRYHGRIPAMLTMLLGLTGFAALGYGLVADLDGVGLRRALALMSAVGLVAVLGVLLLARRLGAWSDAKTPVEDPAPVEAATELQRRATPRAVVAGRADRAGVPSTIEVTNR